MVKFMGELLAKTFNCVLNKSLLCVDVKGTIALLSVFCELVDAAIEQVEALEVAGIHLTKLCCDLIDQRRAGLLNFE
jgi:hypothetical protein